jgi:hypothetical protein
MNGQYFHHQKNDFIDNVLSGEGTVYPGDQFRERLIFVIYRIIIERSNIAEISIRYYY